jgi:hypothetical protein
LSEGGGALTASGGGELGAESDVRRGGVTMATSARRRARVRGSARGEMRGRGDCRAGEDEEGEEGEGSDGWWWCARSSQRCANKVHAESGGRLGLGAARAGGNVGWAGVRGSARGRGEMWEITPNASDEYSRVFVSDIRCPSQVALSNIFPGKF